MFRESCVLVRVKRSMPAKDKRSRKLSDALDEMNQAEHGNFFGGKKIFHKSQRFSRVANLMSQAIAVWKEKSFPHSDMGERKMPSAILFGEFSKYMDDMVLKVREAAKDFAEHYDEEVMNDLNSKNKGGSLDDYPSKDQIENMGIEWYWTEIPKSDFFEMMAASVVEGLQEQRDEAMAIAQRNAEKLKQMEIEGEKQAVTYVLSKLVKGLDDAANKLTENDRLHKSILTNLRERAENIRKMNVWKSEDIDRICNEITDLSGRYTMDEIKEMEEVKQEVVKSAKDLKQRAEEIAETFL